MDLEVYRESLYYKYLGLLAEHLNRVHDERHAVKYWELIAGPWLRQFIYHAHYRYLRSAGPNTQNGDIGHGFVPYDYLSLMVAFEETEYSTQLAQLVGGHCDPAQAGEWKIVRVSVASVKKTPAVTSLIRGIIRWIFSRAVPCFCARGLVHAPSIPPNGMFAIWWKSHFKLSPLFCTDVPGPASSINVEMRKWRTPPPVTKDQFEQVLGKVLLSQIPVVHLEDYWRVVKHVKHFPRNCRMVFSAMGWHQDEPFKVFAACMAERGARLVGHQHGGGYGIAKSKLLEYEASLTDVFLTWGWTGLEKTKPFIGLKLSETRYKFDKLVEKTAKPNILFVSSAVSRNLPDGWPCPAGDQCEQYWESQVIFLKALDGPARKEIVMRLYPHDYFKWDPRGRILSAGLTVKYCPAKNLVSALANAKLVISDNNQTTLLEAYACNVPTVAFFDLDLWPLHPRAEDLFSRMQRVGLFHDTPESAARHVSVVHSSPELWWNAPQTKEVRMEFVDTFARTSPTYLQDLVDVLAQECRFP